MFLTAISHFAPTELEICLVVPVSINISPLTRLESLKLICMGQDISVPNLTPEQRDYLWKTLHKLDLMAFTEETLKRGTVFTELLQEFDSLEIEVGLFGTPDSEWYKRPYIRIAGPPDPDRDRRFFQRAIDPEGGQPPSTQSWVDENTRQNAQAIDILTQCEISSDPCFSCNRSGIRTSFVWISLFSKRLFHPNL